MLVQKYSVSQGGKWNHLSMTHRLTTNNTKNYCNWTLIVKVNVENEVTGFFWYNIQYTYCPCGLVHYAKQLGASCVPSYLVHTVTYAFYKFTKLYLISRMVYIHGRRSQQTGNQSHRDGWRSMRARPLELPLSDSHDVIHMLHPWTTVKQRHKYTTDLNKTTSCNTKA